MSCRCAVPPPDPGDLCRIALPPEAGGWWRMRLGFPVAVASPVLISVEADTLPGPVLSVRGRGRRREAILCLPGDATALRVIAPDTAGAPAIALDRLSRPRAALGLAARAAPGLLATLARGLRAPCGLLGRLRARLAEHAAPAPEASAPHRLHRAVPLDGPAVSLIVPSICRGRAARACLRAMAARTRYSDLELILVLAQPGPPDHAQRRFLAGFARDNRARTVIAPMPAFHFARACNRGADAARGALLCLLNDDVTPRDPGWLAAMAGHLADPAVGVVGARLLYPDGTVQHAGVTLCADGTGRHAYRFLPARAPGADGGALRSREVAAVTGACLLTRRTLWDRLGGLDESFASAFNDIDYCLRARQAGARTVIAAEAELTHAESRSFRRHYRADEAARNRADRARMLARFPAAFAAARVNASPTP